MIECTFRCCCKYVLLAVVVNSAVSAIDKTELQGMGRLPIYGRIIWEGQTSVVIEKRRGDTTLPVEAIKRMTYSYEGFTTKYRMVSFGSGYQVKRGPAALEFIDEFDLEAGDTLIPGDAAPLGLLFRSGTQVRVEPGSRALITGVREPSDSGGTTVIEATLLNGRMYVTEMNTTSDKVELVVHTPAARIRPHSAVFHVSFDTTSKVTKVSVLDGNAGVQLIRSKIGEVIINKNERVTVSSEKQKVMQEEISQEDILEFKKALAYFKRRTTGKVVIPKKISDWETRLCLLRSDIIVYGKEYGWVIPAAGYGRDIIIGDPLNHVYGGIAAGYNFVPWMVNFIDVVYNHDLMTRRDENRIEYTKSSDDLRFISGVVTFSARQILYYFTSFSFQGRLILGEQFNDIRTEPEEKFISQVNIDAGGGARLGPFSQDFGLRLSLREDGIKGTIAACFIGRLFRDRLLAGLEVKADTSPTTPNLTVGVKLASALFN